MNKYIVKFDYEVPEFADVTVETPSDDIELVKSIALQEFTDAYPEAIDPEVISIARA